MSKTEQNMEWMAIAEASAVDLAEGWIRRDAGGYRVRNTTNNASNSRAFLRLYPPGLALITTYEYDERIDDLSQWRLIVNAERKMFVYNWRLIAAADEASSVLVAGRLMNWEER